MPNHCYQQVYIYGDSGLVRLIYEGLTGNGYNPNNCGHALNPQFCQLIIPMPFEMNVAPNAKFGSYDVAASYDWRVNNWGTKWDVCDVDITDKIKFDHEKDKAWFTFNCWTAWGPPIPVWQKLVSLGIHVDADYQDEGGMFEGEFVNGFDDRNRGAA